MTTNSMLSIRPDYETATWYGAAWLTQILNAANNSGLLYVDLYKQQATSSNFFSNLTSQDPLIINILGHGNYNIITCQNGQLLLQGCTNDDVLAGRVIYDLSCRAGRDLGNSAVSKGAVSFLGYDEDFIFAIIEGISDPLTDEVARGFFESHNAAPISYIQRKNLYTSYKDSQDKFNYWIEVWNAIDSQVAGFLLWDRDHQVMIPTPKGGFPLLLLAIPLLIIPIAKYLKKTKSL